MRASRAQFLQTRFDAHVDLGCIFFDKARMQKFPYAWMARMQFDKAARHSPHRADEIAQFYAQHKNCDAAVSYFQTRLRDASCSHDPAAWSQLGHALEAKAATLEPKSRAHAHVQTRARAAYDKAQVLAQPTGTRDALTPPQTSARIAAPMPPFMNHAIVMLPAP